MFKLQVAQQGLEYQTAKASLNQGNNGGMHGCPILLAYLEILGAKRAEKNPTV